MRLGFNNDGMAAEIGNSLFKQGCVVLESTKPDVAVLTEQGTNGSGSVAVIDGEMDGSAVALAAGRELANSADAALIPEHLVVVVDIDSVSVLKTGGFSSVRKRHRRIRLQYLGHIREIWISRKTASITGMFFAGSKVQVHTGPIKFLLAIPTWLKFPSARAKKLFSETVVGEFLAAASVITAPLFGASNTAILAGVLKSIGAFVSLREIKAETLRGLARRAKSFIKFKFWNVGASVKPVLSESFDFHVGFAEAAGYVWHKSTVTRLREYCNSFIENSNTEGHVFLT